MRLSRSEDPEPVPPGAALERLGGAVVLVTGGTGFIGRALCGELAAIGATVHSVGRRAQGPPGARHHWSADFSDAATVLRVVREVRPEFVFHLASHVTGAPDVGQVLPAFRDNLQTTVNLLWGLVDVGCRRVVIAGSLVEPDSGSSRSIPNSPYAAAKWASADYARMFHALYQVPVVIARMFMVYGPGQQDEAKLVPYVIRCLLRDEPPRVTSGNHRFDWVFLDDVVGGLMRLAAAPHVDGMTVDLGSGVLTPTRELVDLLCEFVPGSVRPEYGALPDRRREPLRIADVERTRQLIGWHAQIPLTHGLETTVSSYRQPPGAGHFTIGHADVPSMGPKPREYGRRRPSSP